MLVSIVGYKPYTEMMKKLGRGKKGAQFEPVVKQHVDIFYAFHKAGFKPSARSFNVVQVMSSLSSNPRFYPRFLGLVTAWPRLGHSKLTWVSPHLAIWQEDIDHWMLHGSFLHGEWFLEGQRCPGGDHRESLPTGLTERPPAPADFPEARQRLDEFDGCPNQFAYGDNFYQIAVWCAKTAIWAKRALLNSADTLAAAAVTAAVAADAASAAAERAAAEAHNMWARAVARGTPNSAWSLRAAATAHQSAAAAARATSKLPSAARATADAASKAAGSEVLSADVAASAASLAATARQLVEAAGQATFNLGEISWPPFVCHAMDAVDELVADAVIALRTAANATKAASDAIAPPVPIDGDDGVPTSPAAAAAIAAAPALDGLVRMAIKLVEHHGKSGCDGNSNTPVRTLKHAIEHKLMGPNPGTRELVLFLAENKPFTSTPKAGKRGWEAIGRIFYGYMNTDRFTKTVVPDTDGSKFRDSTKHHSFVGRHASAQVFKNGEMQACHEFCPCSPCLLGRYASCTLRSEMGAMHRVAVPWLSGAPLRQLEELQAWGEMLKGGMVIAFTADLADANIYPLEGNYYLAQIQGPAYPVPESQVHASDRFEEGWLVVKARWFEIVTTSPRCYKLRSEERTLVVSEMIRLSTIRFDKVVKRSPRLGDSQFFLSEDTHNMIESCVRDQDV